MTRSHPGKWHELRHHLFSAAVITSAMIWLSSWGLTGALDSLTLLAVNQSLGSSAAAASRRDDAIDPPLVITLSKQLYETRFENTSPLDREKLTTLLSSLIDQTPELLVVDLDLSPATSGEPSDQQKALDAKLDEWSAKTPIVLLVPSVEGTSELSATQAKWMTRRCSPATPGKLYFGTASLPNESGVILRHPRHYPSIGNVARWATLRHTSAIGTGISESCKILPSPDEVCDFFLRNGQLPALRSYFNDIGRECGSDPIDFRWVNDHRKFHGEHIRGAGSLGASAASDRIVFLGGSYDSRDVHATGTGPREGVVIHAAVFASDTSVVPHAVAALIEIAIGVLLGTLFAALWRWRLRAVTRYHNEVYLAHATAGLVHWSLAGALLVGMIAVAVLSSMAMLMMSATALGSGWWLNPVPLVFGMALDGYVVSRQTVAERGGHEESATVTWKIWLVANATRVVGYALIAVTIAFLTYGAFSAQH